MWRSFPIKKIIPDDTQEIIVLDLFLINRRLNEALNYRTPRLVTRVRRIAGYIVLGVVGFVSSFLCQVNWFMTPKPYRTARCNVQFVVMLWQFCELCLSQLRKANGAQLLILLNSKKYNTNTWWWLFILCLSFSNEQIFWSIPIYSLGDFFLSLFFADKGKNII